MTAGKLEIRELTGQREQYLDLLALADAPKFIAKYLQRGQFFVGTENNQTVAVALVTTDDNQLELQNLAVQKSQQNKRYGSQMLDFLAAEFASQYPQMLVRTDEYTASFYQKNGFRVIKRVPDYFQQKYGRVFIDDQGRELHENVWLTREL